MSNATKVACPAGHPYDEANTLVTKQGHRQCRACKRQRAEARRRAAGMEVRGERSMCRNNLHEMTGDNVYSWKGKQRQCKACRKINLAARNYGLTPDQYLDLQVSHAGACGACGVKADRLYIDHDHATGAVRGLLCNGCNLALGHVQDSPEVLRGLIHYLTKER